MAQLTASEYFLEPNKAAGGRALMLLQAFHALDSLVGGDATARIAWMNSPNESIGDLPKRAIQTASALKLTLAYLNDMVVAINAREALRPR